MKVDEPAVMEVRGRDLLSGLPKSIEVNANHVCEAVNEPVSMIVDAVRNTLERTPPELSADIMDRGIVMTGGSSSCAIWTDLFSGNRYAGIRVR